ncbi:MAG: DUF2147 domain-containing protein [Planktomarina sp.]
MKKTLIGAFAAVCIAGLAHAEPIVGVWQTGKEDNGNYAHVEIKPCGANFCGYFLRTYTSAGRADSDLIGQMIVRNMAPKGDGRYQGKVWRPSNDKVYTGKANVSGDTMDLAGCVAGGLICKSTAWTRVK